jgi:Zn-dependent protease with chaperone function
MMVLRTNLNTVAMTVGAVVVTGRHFDSLTAEEQSAVVAHENGHVFHRHASRRIWWLVSGQWSDMAHRCREQEFEADIYAAELGHYAGLCLFLSRVRSNGSTLHPSSDDRAANLKKWRDGNHSTV